MSDTSTNPAFPGSGGDTGSFTERLIALGRRAEGAEGPPPAPPVAGTGHAMPPMDASGMPLLDDASLEITERDIIFDCPRCYGELIVDRDGENMETSCIHCGATLMVPKYMGPPARVGKVQAQYAAGGGYAGAATGNLTDTYRPSTGDYPTGPTTGDFPTGSTQHLLRNLVESVATSTAVPAGAMETATAAAGSTSAEPVPASDRASYTTADGALTEDVLAEMRELNIQNLDMDAVEKQIETVKRHLKENNSQVTEVTGYVNQTSIKLHRFKLQLEKLKKRNSEIHKEMRALKARVIQLGGTPD